MNKISQRTFAKTIAQKMIQDPARRKHWIKMLAAYMVETGIADKVDAVANDVAREIFVQSGELLVRVSSARPLSDATRKQVERIIKEQSGANRYQVRRISLCRQQLRSKQMYTVIVA